MRLWASQPPRAGEPNWSEKLVAWLDRQRGPRLEHMYRTLIRASTNQVIVAGGWIKLTGFDTVVDDQYSAWDNATKRMRLPKLDAIMAVRFSVGLEIQPDGAGVVEVTVTRNGATPAAVLAAGPTEILPVQGSVGFFAPGVGFRVCLTTPRFSDGPLLQMPAGDYFEAWVNSAVGGTVLGNPVTFFEMDLMQVIV